MTIARKTYLLPLLTLLGIVGLSAVSSVHAAVTPVLGEVANYGVISSTYTNTTAGTIINGNLGYTTAPAVNPTVNGITYVATGTYNQAGTDQNTALIALNSQSCTFTFAAWAVDLATDTTHGTIGIYTPGVYCIIGAASIGTAGITLSGNGTFIFRIDGTFTTVDNSAVTLSNSASACDIFRTPTSATTLGADSTFIGIVIGDAWITVWANTTWLGIASAFWGTITTDANTFSTPTCIVINSGNVLPSIVPSYGWWNGGISGRLYSGNIVATTSGNIATDTWTYTTGVTISITGSIFSGSSYSGLIANATTSLLNRPLIRIQKTSSREIPLSFGGGYVKYTYTVTNPGNLALQNVVVSDDKCAPIAGPAGDTNHNGLLDTYEERNYWCRSYISVSTRNTARARWEANGFTARDYTFATVAVGTGTPWFPDTSTSANNPSSIGNNLLRTASYDDSNSFDVPLYIHIPDISVSSSTRGVGLDMAWNMAIPKDTNDVVRFNLGPRPGQVGNAVVAGHYGVSSDGILSVFTNLHKLENGDKIYIEDATGKKISFVVRETKVYNYDDAAAEVFNSSDWKSHLNLITCEWIRDPALQTYSNRLVVFADKE